MGAINSVRRLTIQTISLLEALEPTPMETALKQQATVAMERLVQHKWPHLRLHAFGSSQNGFGGGSSDLDVGLFFDDPAELAALSWNDRIQILASVASILTHNGVLELEQFVYSARVPLLKFWDRRRKIAIDMSVGSPMALQNTRLLKAYGQLDARVRPLVFAVKHWAKQRRINDASNGSLSSYAWIMLVIFFLQTRPAPVLPVLSVDAPEIGAALESSPPDAVGALLAGFFQFYAWDFDYKSNVVSIRLGAALPKVGKWGLGLGTWRFSIEDPIDLQHDVARVVFHCKGQARLLGELRRAAAMTLGAECTLDTICELVEEQRCFICDSLAHAPRDCPDMWLPTTTDTTPPRLPAPAKPVLTKTLDNKKRPRRRTRSKSTPKKKMMLI
ncbi:Poly(A) polymerase [Achlya hypogyna]|uniref:Poly(A) polymerase n=1 Tax=Achlya hypogyna TaxID=1202772 RepID=A0A1V9Z0F8_ACHHY|nr:Poly(A) polymerase [Achlya hypogyna]